MPAPSQAAELIELGDAHVIKVGGQKQAEAAREFFKIPISLPKGDYLVRFEGNELHLYGVKGPIARSKIGAAASPDIEMEPTGQRVTMPGRPTLFIHAQPCTEGDKGAFPIVRKLLPVVEKVAEYQRLKAKSYGPGQEEQKATDDIAKVDLLKAISAAYSAPEVATTPATPPPAPVRPTPRPAAQASAPRAQPTPAPRSYSPPPTSNFSRYSG